LRVVVATVLAFDADAVIVAHHLQKLGAHLATALARLHVHNIARRNRLEAGSTQETSGAGGGGGRRNARNSVWLFDTGNRKCRWRARVFPERESQVLLPLPPIRRIARPPKPQEKNNSLECSRAE
jgi:hypothetical protein